MRRSKEGFGESLRGQLYAQRKRRQRRVHFRVSVEPQSKNKRYTTVQDAEFQTAALKALEQQGRKSPFRVPVAIRMHFHVGVNQIPPQIQSLPKHYLDLLQAPIARRLPHLRKLLLQDDRLVKALFCSYSFAADERLEPYVSLDISTLTDFARELELYQDIIRGRFDHIDEVRGLDIHDPRDKMSFEFDDAIQSYASFSKEGDSAESRYGKQPYEALLWMHQQSAQQAILKQRQPKPIDIATIYGGFTGKRKRPKFRSQVDGIGAGWVRQIYSMGIASVDFGVPATRSGQSNVFKQKVRAALVAMREQYPFLTPLLTTVGITILYIPPLADQKIDLDNLARRVIPYVHSELEPPGTLLHVARQWNTGTAQDERESPARLRRAHQHHLTCYQAFELPRLSEDPPGGNVAILLHSGEYFEDPWTVFRQDLDRWEEAVADALRW